MKIAFIGQKGVPGVSGGIEKHVEELSRSLVSAGHEVMVYTRPNYVSKDKKEWKGIELVSIPSIPSKHLDAISHTFLACFDLLRRDVDIIHFQSIGPSSLIWLVKLLKPKTPVVSTFHCMCYYHQKWGIIAKMYLKFGEYLACKMPKATIAISKELVRYIKEKYGKDSVYIPNGVTVRENKEADEIKRFGLEADNYIVTVSRLVKHKGIHYLIEAYNNLQTDKKLVIVGDGSFTDEYVHELRALANDNLNIIFTGTQKGRVLEELFSNAYLFVQPSESEGLSIALLEGMSYGKAVLVSDIPENLEAIGDTGFSFENKNVDSLTKKLKFLINNKILVESMGKRCKARVEEHYNWKDITKATEKIYRKSISNKRFSYKVQKTKMIKVK